MSEQATSESIRDCSYIITLLQRMVTERCLVDLFLPGAVAAPFITTLLQVRSDEASLLMDDLFPQGVADLHAQTPIQIIGHPKGAEINFITTVQQQNNHQGLMLWKVAMPEQITYRQLRHLHRSVVASLKMIVTLSSGGEIICRGLLYDISAEGIGIRLAKASGIKRNGVYQCSIVYGDGEVFDVVGDIGRAIKVNSKLPVHLGLQRHRGDEQQELMWQRFIAEMERRVLRKNSGNRV
ncbi:MAG: flagellar brake protein [Chromatiales bacterium]|nr:flagellar brake protein [Chromatiales bacterium]